ncbi:MAG TPA: ATPase domain-containing protein [Gemmatimonadaceae bacterium]|jgi:circadian clock protein KaiC|nr:ATPase domain-containing protein [Gemmatimonadaceae bacterium]
MKNKKQGSIRSLTTGVPGLDTVLGGGLPEYSFNLLAGGPGAGKTTLAHQIMFANTTVERPALYFTVLGEPTLKMLRYQRQFSFFNSDLAGSAIQFINLSEEVMDRDLDDVLKRIVDEVERAKPGLVFVDSFRTIGMRSGNVERDARSPLDQFVQRLAIHLTSWEVTSFLLGEYAEQEQRNPVFTVADGILWLSQATDRNSVVRKLQVIKARGRAPMPGLHTFRITDNGLQIFPRIPEQTRARKAQKTKRLSTGVPGMDEMIGGGVIAGDAVMLTGPAGSGKSTIATQFIAEGLSKGETGVIAVFEEYPENYLARANVRNPAIGKMIGAGKLELIYLRPLDLSVDEALAAILEAVQRLKATRVVIDSLSGFEVALAPTFREDFRESLYRLVGALTATGVTVFMTAEVVEGFADVRFTSEKVSFITDEIIIQRYIELEGELCRVMAVIKMRGSDHSHEIRRYEVTADGVVVGEPMTEYDAIITGVPFLRAKT